MGYDFDWQIKEAKELGLKPCQCGGGAYIREIGNSHTKTHCIEMVCSKCNMKRKQCIRNSSGILSFEKLKKGVIEDWNTRPLEQEMLDGLHQAKKWLEGWASAESELAYLNKIIEKAEVISND